jgi:hypothetical protein
MRQAAHSNRRIITDSATALQARQIITQETKGRLKMRSHYKTFSVSQIDKDIQQATKKELTKYKDEIYDKVTWDVFQQALACCLIALEQMGWRKKRLSDFVEKVDDVTHLMYTGAMGREFTTSDALRHMKDAYGIDLSKSQYQDEYERDAERKKNV